MLRFVKDSIRELKHVVWPTRKETQKYFWLVLALIVIFWIYLFIFSQAFSELLFTLRDTFWSWQSQSQTQNLDFDISDIFTDEEISQEGMLLDENDVNLDLGDIEADMWEDMEEIDSQE